MRRVTAVLFAIVLGVVVFSPIQVSSAVGGCAGGEDYNGDGFADLAIGVPGEDIGTVTRAGAVQVIYGGSGGLSSAGDQVFHQDTAGMNDTAEPSNHFGSSLASGDFDGDGFDDLAVGVPFEDLGGGGEGAVQIIYGSATGLSSSGDQVFHRDTPDVEDDPENFDEFGGALAACDFNGDGRDDLAVGVLFDDVNFESGAGSVNVLYGSAGGLSAAGDQLFHQDVLNDAAEETDNFGISLAAGDYNADGRGDLAVGVQGEDLESLSLFNVGAVHVIYGGATGLSDVGNSVFTQDTPGMNETAEGNDAFGWAISSGDFNGDGFDDLSVAVPFENIGGTIFSAGAIHIIYGGSSGLSSVGDQVFHQETSGMNDTSESGDAFGFSMATGDFNGDGFDDVAVGIPFEDLSASNEGAVQVVYGTGAGLSSAGDQVFHQDTPGMNDTAEHADTFAIAVTSGDLNSDGFDDLVSGVGAEDVSGVDTNDGAVQAVYGTAAGLSSAGDQVVHQNTDGINDTAEETDFFGAALVLSPDIANIFD